MSANNQQTDANNNGMTDAAFLQAAGPDGAFMMDLFHEVSCKDEDPSPAQDFLKWKNRESSIRPHKGYVFGHCIIALFIAVAILCMIGTVGSEVKSIVLTLIISFMGIVLSGIAAFLLAPGSYNPEVWKKFILNFWVVLEGLTVIPLNKVDLHKAAEEKLVEYAIRIISYQAACNESGEEVFKVQFKRLHAALLCFGLAEESHKKYYDLARQRQASQSKETEAASKAENLAKGPIELADIQTGGRL